MFQFFPWTNGISGYWLLLIFYINLFLIIQLLIFYCKLEKWAGLIDCFFTKCLSFVLRTNTTCGYLLLLIFNKTIFDFFIANWKSGWGLSIFPKMFQFCSMDKRNQWLAIAGSRGLACCNLAKMKWKFFGNENQVCSNADYCRLL